MFARPKEVLKAREGTLAATPFPLLLVSLLTEERTCTLEVRLRNLEKRIVFEDGAPVACQSNLLHETLGRYLVERGKLTEPQFQQVLAESAASGKQLGSLLVEKQLISAFDLYKQLQANLAHKILDCFRWQDAKWRLLDFEPPSSPIRMNSLQLVFTGTANFLPFETVATHLVFVDEQRFALVPDAEHPLEDLKLSTKDARFVQVLKDRPVFADLQAKTGLDTEVAMRRLFALCVLGMADLAEAVDARPPPSPKVVPAPAPAPAPARAEPQGLSYLDDDEPAKNALATEFLAHRGKDPFDLLGVPVDVQAPALKKAFLSKCAALPPARFRSADLREKAENLLAAYARAFGALAEYESYLLCRKRRETANEAKRGANRPTAAEQFRIRTDLLDAASQFEEGKRRLETGLFKAAVEYFEYACDIEPRGRHRAYLAWARYQLNPNTAGRQSLADLVDACAAEPECEAAWAFRAQLSRALGDAAGAEEAYRRAFKLNPNERSYADAVRDLSRAGKR